MKSSLTFPGLRIIVAAAAVAFPFRVEGQDPAEIAVGRRVADVVDFLEQVLNEQ